VLRSTFLQRFEASSKSLQKVESDLDTVANIYRSLEEYVSDIRDKFNEFDLQASELCGQDKEYEEDNERRRRRKNHMTKF